MEPGYLALRSSGELAARAVRAWSRLRRCSFCPRDCRVDRLAGGLGECRTGARARVAGYGPHFGEEAPLVARGGSGTVFFAGCNLVCVFCQNHDISHPAGDPAANAALPGGQRVARGAAGRGVERAAGTGGAVDQEAAGATRPATPLGASPALRWEVTPERVARMMLELQDRGCENINLVSPTHVVPQILAALVLAVEDGLHLPLVYNTGGYDSLATLRLLDGIVDIYMPDMKYADAEAGLRLSGVPDYPRRNRAAVLEMHRQVGDLRLDERGVARRGLLVRHLVLPGGSAGTAEVARFLAGEVSPDTYVNVMDQYRPAYLAARYPEICRSLTVAECREAVQAALTAGLRRLDGLDVVVRPERDHESEQWP
ncbi:MAG: radical SAM protein [Actinomycetia bacterium]|nr:radical SAM protein [Actinomycetes bacterium]